MDRSISMFAVFVSAVSLLGLSACSSTLPGGDNPGGVGDSAGNHLSPTDTVARDRGIDLSADADLRFAVDIDGEVRAGTWDLGADETP